MLDQDLTRNRDFVDQALSRKDARGGTALFDAVIASADHLAKAKSCNKRVLLVVSDGEDNSSRKSLVQAISAVQGAGNPAIYAISLPDHSTQSSRGRHTLEKLTSATGGAVYFAGSAKDLGQAALNVAEDLRNQYTLTYVPPVPATTSNRLNVKVEANAPDQKKLSVRTNVATNPDVPSAPASATPAQPAHAVDRSSCISGTVLDAQRQPVAAVTIEAWPLFAGNSYTNGSYPSTLSDEDGKFKLVSLEAGQYQLYTSKESAGYPPTKNAFYRDRAVNFALASIKCSSLAIRIGPRAASVLIKVLDATTHDPVPHFGVELRNAAEDLLVVNDMDSDHDILVPPNTQLTAKVWSKRYVMSQPFVITPVDPEAPQEFPVNLEPRVRPNAPQDPAH